MSHRRTNLVFAATAARRYPSSQVGRGGACGLAAQDQGLGRREAGIRAPESQLFSPDHTASASNVINHLRSWSKSPSREGGRVDRHPPAMRPWASSHPWEHWEQAEGGMGPWALRSLHQGAGRWRLGHDWASGQGQAGSPAGGGPGGGRQRPRAGSETVQWAPLLRMLLLGRGGPVGLGRPPN